MQRHKNVNIHKQYTDKNEIIFDKILMRYAVVTLHIVVTFIVNNIASNIIQKKGYIWEANNVHV